MNVEPFGVKRWHKAFSVQALTRQLSVGAVADIIVKVGRRIFDADAGFRRSNKYDDARRHRRARKAFHQMPFDTIRALTAPHWEAGGVRRRRAGVITAISNAFRRRCMLLISADWWRRIPLLELPIAVPDSVSRVANGAQESLDSA